MTRIGIRLSIYDDADNEVWHTAAWMDAEAHEQRRDTYDTLCAALWDASEELHAQVRLIVSPAAISMPAKE
jgi:hypothetical protein